MAHGRRCRRAGAGSRTGWRRPPRDRPRRQVEIGAVPCPAKLPAEIEHGLPGPDVRGVEADGRRAAHNATPACRVRATVAACRDPRAAAQHRLDRLARDAARAAAGRAAARQDTMVDSSPTAVGPPSSIRSTRPSRSASTCAAVRRADPARAVGRGRRDRTRRPPPSKARATGCEGTRSATLSSPARARSQTSGRARSARPASAARARRPRPAPRAAGRKRPCASAASSSATWAISGLKRGRPLAA